MQIYFHANKPQLRVLYSMERYVINDKSILPIQIYNPDPLHGWAILVFSVTALLHVIVQS